MFRGAVFSGHGVVTNYLATSWKLVGNPGWQLVSN